MKKIVYLSLIAASFAFDVNAAYNPVAVQGGRGRGPSKVLAVALQSASGKSEAGAVFGGSSRFGGAPTQRVMLDTQGHKPALQGRTSLLTDGSLQAPQTSLMSLGQEVTIQHRNPLNVAEVSAGSRVFFPEVMTKDMDAFCQKNPDLGFRWMAIADYEQRGAPKPSAYSINWVKELGASQIAGAPVNVLPLLCRKDSTGAWNALYLDNYTKAGAQVLARQTPSSRPFSMSTEDFAATYMHDTFNTCSWQAILDAFLCAHNNPWKDAKGGALSFPSLANIASVVNGITTFIVNPITGQEVQFAGVKSNSVLLLSMKIGVTSSLLKTLLMNTPNWLELLRILGAPMSKALWGFLNVKSQEILKKTGVGLVMPTWDEYEAKFLKSALPTPAARPALMDRSALLDDDSGSEGDEASESELDDDDMAKGVSKKTPDLSDSDEVEVEGTY